jgi:SOUL heme-binding protein
MGSIIGKQTVAEPVFESLLNRTHHVKTGYEIRRYGQRFVAEVEYSDADDTGTPFGALASYIGVFGNPQNDGGQAIAMTAPVVIQGSGTPIAMTAPVVTANDASSGSKIMKFMLPAEYDDISKIPKPTNPAVRIEAIPAQTGAVHRYSGNRDEDQNREMAIELAEQLISDGLDDISVDYVLEHFQVRRCMNCGYAYVLRNYCIPNQAY